MEPQTEPLEKVAEIEDRFDALAVGFTIPLNRILLRIEAAIKKLNDSPTD